MKKILTILFVIVLNMITLAQKYEANELFVLSWGNENNQQLPYAYNDLGGFWEPFQQYVDGNENIYLAYPIKDFRKYDFSGSQNSQKISWIKNRKGKIVAGNLKHVAEVYKSGLNEIEFQRKNPVDSKGKYYFTETHMGMSEKQKQEAISYNKNFVHLYKFYFSGSELVKKDTVELNICRYPHKAAEVVQIDENDNFYIWIFYGPELPVDLVILDSALKEINRIEMTAPEKTMGLSARPFVCPDGTVYEFRDLEDGLHVIRWSREE